MLKPLHNEVWYHETAPLLGQVVTRLRMTHKVNKITSYCGRKFVACWTTRCVKGLLTFNTLAFTHVSPDVTTSKLCGDSIFGNFVWHFVYKNLWFISVKKLATFSYIVEVFLPQKSNLISENFKLVSQKSKTFSLSDQSLDWRFRWRLPGEWGVEV